VIKNGRGEINVLNSKRVSEEGRAAIENKREKEDESSEKRKSDKGENFKERKE